VCESSRLARGRRTPLRGTKLGITTESTKAEVVAGQDHPAGPGHVLEPRTAGRQITLRAGVIRRETS